MKRFIWYTLTAVVTLGILALLWQFRAAVVLFLLSLALASVFRPAIDALTNRGLPRFLAILLTYITGLGLVIVPFILVSGALLNELQAAGNDFTNVYNVMKGEWPNSGRQFQQAIATRLPPLTNLTSALAGNQGTLLAQGVLGFAANVADTLSNLVIVIVLSIYWSADKIHFERLWLSILPPENRAKAREIWRRIEAGVGAYLRSEIVQSILMAFILGVIYSLIGLRYPVLLALFSALVWLIPWLGAVIALVPPFLVGLTVSPALAAAAAIITLVVLLLMETIVEPRIFSRQKFSSLLAVVLVIAMADAYGVMGLLLAPPLAAAIQIFFSSFQSQPSVETQALPLDQLAGLHSRLASLQAQAAEKRDESPANINMLERLDKLVSRAETTIREEGLAGQRPAGLY